MDVISATDTNVVVCVPGLGDEIQAMKAGVMEIGDIFAANKADLKNVEKLINDLELILHMGMETREWEPPVVKTIATQDRGVDHLVEMIFKHRAYLIKSGALQKKKEERIRREIIEIAKNEMVRRFETLQISNQNVSEGLIDKVMLGKTDPYTAAEDLLDLMN